jgi:eukaryotic-like serine/threonine-protein kinase
MSQDATLSRPLLLRVELLDRLTGVLETLTCDEREAVEAHFLAGTSQLEIAEKLGRTREAVTGLIRVGINKLERRLLEPLSQEGIAEATETFGLTGETDAILSTYFESLETGHPLDRREFLATHPHLAANLSRFFVGYDAVHLWFLSLTNERRLYDDASTVTDRLQRASRALPKTLWIGRYQLSDVIGGGGQGVVYRAVQRGAVERTVAVKTLRAEGLAAERDVATFLIEMQLMTELDHPGLVSILDSGIEDGRPFLVMPLMVGGSLSRILSEGGLPDPKTAAAWLSEIARAVEYLNDRNMIHRDLKPSNILFDAQGLPRVADFGLVRLVEQAGGTPQASSVVVEGTASYMAPEQASGRIKSIGRWTDVYGMGAILYEVLTGRPPFRSDSFMKTLARVMEAEPESPRHLRPEIPLELEAICLKCLEKDPSDRYESAGKLAGELDRFRHDLPLVFTHPPGLIRRIGRWARNEPGLATRLFVVFACVAVIGVNWLSAAAGKYQPRKMGWSIGPLSGGPDSLRWINLALLLTWGLAAVGFQAALRRGRPMESVIRAWLGTDVALATVLLIIDGQPLSPLTAVYPVLIAASGLWSKVRVVAFTTALAMIGYVVLIAESWAKGRPIGYRYAHIDFIAALALMALITAHQVRRVRALGSLIDDGRAS